MIRVFTYICRSIDSKNNTLLIRQDCLFLNKYIFKDPGTDYKMIAAKLQTLYNRYKSPGFVQSCNLLTRYEQADMKTQEENARKRARNAARREENPEAWKRKIFEQGLPSECKKHKNKSCIQCEDDHGRTRYYCDKTNATLWYEDEPDIKPLYLRQQENEKADDATLLQMGKVDRVRMHEYPPWMNIINMQKANMVYREDGTPAYTTPELNAHREFHRELEEVEYVHPDVGEKYARFHLQRFLYHSLKVPQTNMEDILGDILAQKNNICKACIYKTCEELNIFGWEFSNNTGIGMIKKGSIISVNPYTLPPMYDYDINQPFEKFLLAMLPDHLHYLNGQPKHAQYHLIQDLDIQYIWYGGLAERLKWLWSLYVGFNHNAQSEITDFINMHISDVTNFTQQLAAFRFSHAAREEIGNFLHNRGYQSPVIEVYAGETKNTAPLTDAEREYEREQQDIVRIHDAIPSRRERVIRDILERNPFIPNRKMGQAYNTYAQMWKEHLFKSEISPESISVPKWKKRYRDYIITQILTGRAADWVNDTTTLNKLEKKQIIHDALNRDTNPEEMNPDIKESYIKALIKKYVSERKFIGKVFESIRERYKHALFVSLYNSNEDCRETKYRNAYEQFRKKKERGIKRRLGEFKDPFSLY